MRQSRLFDDITTGASNDIEKATSIARSMVTQYGMSSKFGMGLRRFRAVIWMADRCLTAAR